MAKMKKFDYARSEKTVVSSRFNQCIDLMHLWQHAYDAKDPEAMREALRLLRLAFADVEAKAETRTSWAEKGVPVTYAS